MARWEYCYFNRREPSIVVFLNPEGEAREPVKGCDGTKWYRTPSIEQQAACAIAQLGEDGWEAFELTNEGIVIWFKRWSRRPKQDQKP